MRDCGSLAVWFIDPDRSMAARRRPISTRPLDWTSDQGGQPPPLRSRAICRFLLRAIWPRRARRRADSRDARGLSRKRPRLHALAPEIMSDDAADSSGRDREHAELLPSEPISIRIAAAVKLTGIGR